RGGRGEQEAEVSVPKFDKIPWFSEASLVNKPLVLSLPKRSPDGSATFLISSKKNVNLPILFQVPDDLPKARRSQSDPMLIRNKQLCSKCREIKMVQPRTMMIPDDLQLSFENLLSHKMMSLQPPRDQTAPKCPYDDIPTGLRVVLHPGMKTVSPANTARVKPSDLGHSDHRLPLLLGGPVCSAFLQSGASLEKGYETR
ncbi:uncharacterized protein C1orf105 homolog, partial [Pteropus vampyrus]|uniref:Uncharacterized protein C1orf105 homolog n=1 Tax=Pteropus vampyrus TaxID=132908 RepID=A0A6P6D1A7_PTEVA